MADEVAQLVPIIYRRAVAKMLVEFHGFERNLADQVVATVLADVPDTALLHQEPYMTAAELAGEEITLTNERCEQDIPRSQQIWEEIIAEIAIEPNLRAKSPKTRYQISNLPALIKRFFRKAGYHKSVRVGAEQSPANMERLRRLRAFSEASQSARPARVTKGQPAAHK